MMLVYILLGILQLSNALGTDVSSEEVFDVDSETVNGTIMDYRPSLELPNCDHTWTYLSNGRCQCGGDVRGTVRCSTILDRVSVLACSCMTYDDDKDGVVTATCPYGHGYWYASKNLSWNYDPDYHILPSNITELNNAMCGRLNRDGLLCSKCKDDSSLIVYSYDLYCIKCSSSNYNWLKFMAVAFIPLTLFYFVVILFRINATNPYLYGFITFNQVLASPLNLRAIFLALRRHSTFKNISRILVLPIAMWNLDFFRSLILNICLDNISMLQSLMLDYIIAVYPLFLVIV